MEHLTVGDECDNGSMNLSTVVLPSENVTSDSAETQNPVRAMVHNNFEYTGDNCLETSLEGQKVTLFPTVTFGECTFNMKMPVNFAGKRAVFFFAAKPVDSGVPPTAVIFDLSDNTPLVVPLLDVNRSDFDDNTDVSTVEFEAITANIKEFLQLRCKNLPLQSPSNEVIVIDQEFFHTTDLNPPNLGKRGRKIIKSPQEAKVSRNRKAIVKYSPAETTRNFRSEPMKLIREKKHTALKPRKKLTYVNKASSDAKACQNGPNKVGNFDKTKSTGQVGKLLEKIDQLEQKVVHLEENSAKIPTVQPMCDNFPLSTLQQTPVTHPPLALPPSLPNFLASNQGQGSEALQAMKFMVMSQMLNFMQR